MTNPDPFADISRQERAALDDLCGRSMLLAGDVQRIAFLHNASFNRVRSMLPAYRAAKQATATTATAPGTPPPAAPSKPSKWPRLRK